ncbi:hypothetical protein IMZ31_22240 (plasmid) [Pontibacillus sp. ALD_SL1]|uniref:hypothetical protein n=1 Tax=Pontibacillus sp. ALD_SL1 TaxID=2777185 RepID=UPI001A97D03F|nr:hypothetical protein [Pontibacillus sp. ALD_SL1]QST02175.1 hypothetical protein IMZ31_22240 [Pontibacillus sp. ALD_SL1]
MKQMWAAIGIVLFVIGIGFILYFSTHEDESNGGSDKIEVYKMTNGVLDEEILTTIRDQEVIRSFIRSLRRAERASTSVMDMLAPQYKLIIYHNGTITPFHYSDRIPDDHKSNAILLDSQKGDHLKLHPEKGDYFMINMELPIKE